MNTMFFWVNYLDGRLKVETAIVAKRQHRFCSAYTSSELGLLLPFNTKTFWRHVDDKGPRWFCEYESEDIEPIGTRAKTEPNARGLMLLEILKLDTPKTLFWKNYED